MNEAEVMELTKDLDDDTICKYCKYEDGCPRGASCNGGEPDFPFCADNGISTYFDYESYLEDQESEVE